jgi:hypothetical protein
MAPLRTISDRLHIGALGIWLGALILMGAGAPMVFSALRSAAPHLPEFSAFDGPHYLIAGGQIVRRLFGVCDGLQVACAIVAEVTFLVGGREGRRAWRIARGVFLAGLVGILAYRLLILEPSLEPSLRDYWAAARAGDAGAVLKHKAAYDAGHRLENVLFAATGLLVLAALAAGVLRPQAGSTPRGPA